MRAIFYKKAVLILVLIIVSALAFGCAPTAPEDPDEGNGPPSPEYVKVEVSYCSEGGSVSFDKDAASVERGDFLYVYFTPDTDAGVQRVLCNGADVTSGVQTFVSPCFYYLGNIQGDIDLTVWFDKAPVIPQERNVSYVSPGDAPVIDGEEDEVWKGVTALTVQNVHLDNGVYEESGYPYLKMLWSEEGLYFYGEVFDSTILPLDTFNVWLKETYTQGTYPNAGVSVPYENDASVGAYSININPYGDLNHYSGIDVSEYWNENSTAIMTETGYVFEVFMPCISKSGFSEGDLIGLDISVDYFSYDEGLVDNPSLDEHRDAYLNWYGKGHYWSDASHLKDMCLVK